MLIFDQLKRHDPHLRLLALVVASGLAILAAGLWWVQIVSAREYQASLENQTFRNVRIPAVRGKIYDRNGVVLAENRPTYNLGLYLEDLSDSFRAEYRRVRPVKVITNELARWEKWMGVSAVRTQKVKLTAQQIAELEQEVRYSVTSNLVQQVGRVLGKPLTVDREHFQRHYAQRRFIPYPVARDIDPALVARFEEQSARAMGLDLEVQSIRVYPHQSTAAHLLGYLTRDNRSLEGEEAFFWYRMPDHRGVVGMEYAFDKELHGQAGAKSVVVNHRGYRQTETIWTQAEPGRNVVLAMDLRIQQAAEKALQSRGPFKAETRGAVVVMDVDTGDVLAMVSSPTFKPSTFVEGFSTAEYQRLTDPKLRPQINRATQENYAPGSIFKTVVGLACLENGLDPRALYEVQPNPQNPARGIIYVGRRAIRDTAPPGKYDFRRALIHSSNAYFISNGLAAGIEHIIRLGQRLHLGERAGLPTRQEAAGYFPDEHRVRSGWSAGQTANLCIGQGDIAVTPLQMAVLAAALANGGKVLYPRLADRVESADGSIAEPVTVFEKGRVRDHLGVKPRNLQILKDAMLADVEDPEGTGRLAAIPGYRICAKTGTAQVMNQRNEVTDHITWFLSFAPYEQPKYAVVVMVESGGSGGTTCAPIAKDVYLALQNLDTTGSPRTGTLAAN